MNGRLVDTKLHGSMEAGTHDLKWDATNTTNGVYIIRMQTGNQEVTQKVLRIIFR
ncbi:MAG: T9SS type A sorting domain-containing protein [Calditrichaeota bacterium]|nr:T9SS type A sorting domain-containing protein [Calditrichota bacterium]MBT7619122.1 T9SS type A sorting domain-containing protein [Calditrichota bacterium]MBT7789932.1 T9SS type A sorting domain-containing protein [Calditrichota bacterium]